MGIKELVERLSSYNLFNYFFPGLIFVIILRETTSFDLYQDDFLIGAFLYYFIGMVISRVGSIVVESLLWKTGFVKKINIPKLIGLIQTNNKLELLYEVSNVYRTVTATFLILVFIKCYDIIKNQSFDFCNLCQVLFGILLFVLFLFAFRKQNEYVDKCVEAEPDK